MLDVVTPLEAQSHQNTFEHVEVVILFITHDIDQFLRMVLVITQLSGSQVLSHINGCAVTTQQQLLVESLIAEVAPH